MDRHAEDDKHASRDAVAAAIADTAASCGISLVASLPDGWITSLIARFDADHGSDMSPSIARNPPSGCALAPSSVASEDLP